MYLLELELKLKSASCSLIQHRTCIKLAPEPVREDTDCVIKPSRGSSLGKCGPSELPGFVKWRSEKSACG